MQMMISNHVIIISSDMITIITKLLKDQVLTIVVNKLGSNNPFEIVSFIQIKDELDIIILV